MNQNTTLENRRHGAARRAGAVLMACLLALGAGAAGAPALAQGTVQSTHGEWNYVCDTPPGARDEQCALIQSVVAEDQQNVGLTVVILLTADKQLRLMRVLAPLGVLLPAGLGLRIDDEDVGNVPFVRCLANGCIAEVRLEDDLAGKLSGGGNATFIIFETPEQGIGIPINLTGFAEGLAKLQ